VPTHEVRPAGQTARRHGAGKLNTADCLSRRPDPTCKHTSVSEPGSDLRGRMLAGCWADAWHNNPDNRRVRKTREGLSYEEKALTIPDDDTARKIEPKHHPVACMRSEPCSSMKGMARAGRTGQRRHGAARVGRVRVGHTG